ncbi:hypothetical protein WJ96_04510 [Burkholderia ubonensis]|uniref:Uncharacterized protein n=1 Tax=Burkholderia ubonensis TaxID=101571 RepID=A0AAW3MX00_9BURK|nr:hypothetical protein WJ93_24245 [Burkholderia ubonensis]KVP97838.1 hypothetical protein WJ96_04510 [Burkholderia ubonensis]KVZ92535.1 hypothetical protein WL25_16165 [Burkholderia ubonensis]
MHVKQEFVVNKNEAQKLIGRNVRVWLGAEGVYVGELLELTGSPWRGRVRVTGVLEPAQHLDHGVVCRRGHRPGEFIDVSHATVCPAKKSGHSSYLSAVQAQLNLHMGSHSGYQTSRHAWVNEAFGRALRAVLVAEERRVATGQWRLRPEDGEHAAA